jgi:hypothetical protein
MVQDFWLVIESKFLEKQAPRRRARLHGPQLVQLKSLIQVLFRHPRTVHAFRVILCELQL